MFEIRLIPFICALALGVLMASHTAPAAPGLGKAGPVASVGAGQDANPAKGGKGPKVGGPKRYNATVRRTALGIPHITAHDYGSFGYGLGYAQAQDNLSCSSTTS